MRFLRLAIVAGSLLVPFVPSLAQENSIVVASTTSTENSGLFGYLLPIFKQKTDIEVRIVALGTGQALDVGKRGDADVVFVHAKSLEEKFVADGEGVERFDVMYNDFIIVGPTSDPARILGGKDAIAAFKKIAAAKAPFVSRGDRSGTHVAELDLWKQAAIDPQTGRGVWYNEIGQGMGPSLNTASSLNGYVLADRGTWISFKNRGDLTILVEGDIRLFNQYGVILVNPANHPNVKKDLGQTFIDWLIGTEGQKAIADYKIEGQQLFFPNARGRNGS